MWGEQTKKIRIFVFSFLSALSFCTFFIMLFRVKEVLLASLSFILYHLFFSFLAFEKRKFSFKKIGILSILLAFILSFTLSHWSRQGFGAMVSALLSIPLFRYSKQSSLIKDKSFHPRRYFSGGTSILLLIFSLIFGLSLLGNVHTLPFSCQEATDRSSRFSLSLLQKEQKSDFSETIDSPNLRSQFTSTLYTTKDFLWDNLLSTQKKINYQICTSIFDQLHKLSQRPAFQIAFLFAVYMLSYGVMRFLLKIIAGIGTVIFRIARYAGRYQIEKSLGEIESVK